MSTIEIEARMAVSDTNEVAARARTARELPRSETPIVPKGSIAVRSLLAVIAIMSFLASLTTGAVILVRATAQDWQADVAREVTLQVRPLAGRDLQADVTAAAALARAVPGVAEVQPFTKEQSAKLLEPWLGHGLVLDDLPVPRMIVVRVAQSAHPDWTGLRRALEQKVPSATLDDHRSWTERMRSMARTALAGGGLLLLLMIVATVLSVTFATRGAMATNRTVIEVLHFVGARNRFIAGHFQQHFLMLGLQGGAIGGGAAILGFLMAQLLSYWSSGSEVAMLFGTFALGVTGYAALFGQIVLIAAVTALTARVTVNRTLESVE